MKGIITLGLLFLIGCSLIVAASIENIDEDLLEDIQINLNEQRWTRPKMYIDTTNDCDGKTSKAGTEKYGLAFTTADVPSYLTKFSPKIYTGIPVNVEFTLSLYKGNSDNSEKIFTVVRTLKSDADKLGSKKIEMSLPKTSLKAYTSYFFTLSYKDSGKQEPFLCLLNFFGGKPFDGIFYPAAAYGSYQVFSTKDNQWQLSEREPQFGLTFVDRSPRQPDRLCTSYSAFELPVEKWAGDDISGCIFPDARQQYECYTIDELIEGNHIEYRDGKRYIGAISDISPTCTISECSGLDRKDCKSITEERKSCTFYKGIGKKEDGKTEFDGRICVRKTESAICKGNKDKKCVRFYDINFKFSAYSQFPGKRQDIGFGMKDVCEFPGVDSTIIVPVGNSAIGKANAKYCAPTYRKEVDTKPQPCVCDGKCLCACELCTKGCPCF